MIDPLAPDVLARLEALVYDDDARLNGAEWGCNVRRSQLAALLAVARDHARMVEAFSESLVPDGHTRIDGKLFRLERHGDLNRYGLVRAENPAPVNRPESEDPS